MRKLFQKLGEVLRNGEDAVLATVIASSGSTPRGAGARMLVTEKGRIYGTVGGGAVEYESERAALEALKTKNSHKGHYTLTKNQIQDIGMVCGGEVYIHFLFAEAGDSRILALTGEIEALYKRGEQSWLVSEVTPGQDGFIGLYGKKTGPSGTQIPDSVIERLGNRPVLLNLGGHEYYCEQLVRAGLVYILGGGHVTQALVPVLAPVGFRCVVLEDREEFCQRSLFPGAEDVRLIDNRRVSDYITVTGDDYIVIMTRGHKDDQLIQAQMLKTRARYIGVIGSRRKSATVAANLREMGFSDAELSRITTPIGLDIKAETPAEIAVSIAAQLIMTRAQLDG